MFQTGLEFACLPQAGIIAELEFVSCFVLRISDFYVGLAIPFCFSLACGLKI